MVDVLGLSMLKVKGMYLLLMLQVRMFSSAAPCFEPPVMDMIARHSHVCM